MSRFWASLGGIAPSGADNTADNQKWGRMIQQGLHSFRKKHPDKFRKRLCRGIPPQHRWVAWKSAVGLRDKMQPGKYSQLCAIKSDWAQLIDVDAPRTFPEVSEFGEEYRNSLRHILYAYSNWNTEVGYCQGMNFIVGLLLLVSSREEEEVFWMFTCLMEDRCLNGFYREKFPLLHQYLHAMSQLMDTTLPDLREHFSYESLEPSDYLQQWFLTLFISCLPLPTVLIIWDGLICDGLHTLLSTSLALLQAVKHILLTMPFEEIMGFFRVMKVHEEATDAVTIGQLLMRKSYHVDIPLTLIRQLKLCSKANACRPPPSK